MRTRFISVLCVTLLALAGLNVLAQKQVTYKQVVVRAAPTMPLSASALAIPFGSPLTLSATLASQGQAPTGQISFFDGGSALVQNLPLQPRGADALLATYTFSTLPGGVHTITASYSGDANYLPVISAPVTVAVNPIPGFAISATPVTVVRGSSSGNASTVTLSSVGNFAGTVLLGAGFSSVPQGASSLPVLRFTSGNPTNLTGSSPQVAVLSVATTAPSGAAASREGGRDKLLAAGAVIVAGMAIFGAPRRRRWQFFLGLSSLLAILATALSGCNEIHLISQPRSVPPTTPGTYVVAITGASGTVTASGFFTLIVQ